TASSTLDGGEGFNSVDYEFVFSGPGMTINLTAGSGSRGDVLINIQGVIGSSYNDSIIGNLFGDSVNGYTGNDTIEGSAGADTLDGSSGINIASYTGSAIGVTVNLATGTGSGGDAQGDVLFNIQGLIGSGYADSLVGTSGADSLEGGAGDDTLIGGLG